MRNWVKENINLMGLLVLTIISIVMYIPVMGWSAGIIVGIGQIWLPVMLILGISLIEF